MMLQTCMQSWVCRFWLQAWNLHLSWSHATHLPDGSCMFSAMTSEHDTNAKKQSCISRALFAREPWGSAALCWPYCHSQLGRPGAWTSYTSSSPTPAIVQGVFMYHSVLDTPRHILGLGIADTPSHTMLFIVTTGWKLGLAGHRQ